MKTSTLLWGLAFSLAATVPATAQFFPHPSGNDYPPMYTNGAKTQTEVKHTGTDVIRTDEGIQLQAMVWDNSNGQVVFSLSQHSGTNNAIPSQAFDIVLPNGFSEASDPDVVMAYMGKKLYANVVYLASGNGFTRTYRNVYLWNGSQFVPWGNPQALGRLSINNIAGYPGPNPIPRVHSSPNIDANREGVVGIVWQEASVETATITVVSPSYPSGYTYQQNNLVFAESFVVPGTIDGGLSCSSTPSGYLVSKNTDAIQTAQNPPILYNQTLKPDVAVSPTGKIWVSYIVSAASQGEPPVQAGLNLVVKQFEFDMCDFVITKSNVWSKDITLDPPRIAATPNLSSPDNVEVVQAGTGGGCFSNSWYIRNFGYSDTKFRENYTIVNDGVVDHAAEEPVVAFYSGQYGEYSDKYFVAWTGHQYNTDDTNEEDIWARTLHSGDAEPDISKVNKEFDGTQRTPSVAARYSGESNSSAHLFVNDHTEQLGHKLTPTMIGTDNLDRPGSSVGDDAPSPARAERLQAFPNPFQQQVDFKVSLKPGEVVQQLVVMDMLGRVVETVPVPASQAQQRIISWKPKQHVPAGTYSVKLVTSQRTEIAVLKKQ